MLILPWYCRVDNGVLSQNINTMRVFIITNNVDIMTKWVNVNKKTALTVSTLYCSAALKTRKRLNLKILRYPKSKTISSLIYRYIVQLYYTGTQFKL